MGKWKTLDSSVDQAYEDFTGFTEVDVGADRIQKTANHIDHASVMNETTYLYKDYGAGHFGDFTHKFIARMLSGDNAVNTYTWMLTNDVNGARILWTGDKDFLGVRFARSGGSYHIFLSESAGGELWEDGFYTGSVNTWYFLKIVKSGTTCNLYIYSDEAYETLVGTLTLTLKSDYSFRYLYGCNTWNDNGAQDAVMDIEKILIAKKWYNLERESGSVGWKELLWEITYEDFSTFTEVDVGADRIQKTANHIDHLAYRNETTYLYKDYGAGHFDDFTHKIVVKAISGATHQGIAVVWMVANDLGNKAALESGSKTFVCLYLYNNSGTLGVYMREAHSGSAYQDGNSGGFAFNASIYVKLVKNGTSMYAYLYSDSSYTTLVDTLELTLHADHTLKYLYGCNTHNSGNTMYFNTDVDNFDLG